MQLEDGWQISEAVPMDDGSLTTALLDQDGVQVGSVTRLADGTTQASVPDVQTDTGGYDWSQLLGKVTGFLENAAKTAQGVANEATRINRGIKSAAAGANAGYNAPINWKPWAVAGGTVVVAVIAIAAVGRSSGAGRR